MDTIIVAFEHEAMSQRFSALMEQERVARCLICRSGDQVRRLLDKQQTYCVVCSPRLTDGPAEWLYQDLPPACALLLVGPQHVLDACSSDDVFKLATPIRREEAVSTVRLLIQFGHRVERLLHSRRSTSEQELVERAKNLLMERKGLSEEEAHRLIQKRSMDTGARLVQTARRILREYERL